MTFQIADMKSSIATLRPYWSQDLIIWAEREHGMADAGEIAELPIFIAQFNGSLGNKPMRRFISDLTLILSNPKGRFNEILLTGTGMAHYELPSWNRGTAFQHNQTSSSL